MLITHVAVKYKNVVYSLPKPNRHHDVILLIAKINNLEEITGIYGENQGFLLEDRTYVNRIEGAEIALKSGQITELKWPPNLFSEDLW